MRAAPMARSAFLPLALVAFAASAAPVPPDDLFRTANEQARSGDYPKACALYEQLARSGTESASLYWNWAQVATARGGAEGESLWAFLRAREVDPWDPAVVREIERRREALSLDAAEVAPDPFAGVARVVRPLRLEWCTLALLLVSVALHAGSRGSGRSNVAVRLRWAAGTALGLAVMALLVVSVAAAARPAGVVVRRNAPLFEAASPSASTVGVLREGEVLPIRGQSGGYLKVQDSSGARGWALAADVRRLQERDGE
jgi:hypothetical protein